MATALLSLLACLCSHWQICCNSTAPAYPICLIIIIIIMITIIIIITIHVFSMALFKVLKDTLQVKKQNNKNNTGGENGVPE